jgi:hypothetical protein
VSVDLQVCEALFADLTAKLREGTFPGDPGGLGGPASRQDGGSGQGGGRRRGPVCVGETDFASEGLSKEAGLYAAEAARSITPPRTLALGVLPGVGGSGHGYNSLLKPAGGSAQSLSIEY